MLFIFSFLVFNLVVSADDGGLSTAYEYLIRGEATKARVVVENIDDATLDPFSLTELYRLRNRIFLDAFSDEAALAKNPNSADVLNPSPFLRLEKKCYGLVDLAYGYSTNAQTLEGMAPGAGEDGLLQGKLNADCLLKSERAHALRIDYQGSATAYNQNHRANYMFHDVTGPLSLYWQRYRLRVIPEAYVDTYGGQNFSNAYGGTVDFGRKLLGAYVSVGVTRLQIRNVSAFYSEQTGYQQRAQLSVQSHFSRSQTFLNVYAGQLGYRDSEVKKVSYRYQGALAGYRADSKPVDLTVALAGELHGYAKAASEDHARRDRKWIVDVQAGYRVREDWRAYVDFNRTETTSDLNPSGEDHGFRQFQMFAGLVAGF